MCGFFYLLSGSLFLGLCLSNALRFGLFRGDDAVLFRFLSFLFCDTIFIGLLCFQLSGDTFCLSLYFGKALLFCLFLVITGLLYQGFPFLLI
jgi:hypothetical protein